MSVTSMKTAIRILGIAFPISSSKSPSAASMKQATTIPLISADRAVEGSAFLAEKSITAIPAYSAAARRPTNPAEGVNSTPQSDNKRLGANIQVSAKAKKRIADKIARPRKLSFIDLACEHWINNEAGSCALRIVGGHQTDRRAILDGMTASERRRHSPIVEIGGTQREGFK